MRYNKNTIKILETDKFTTHSLAGFLLQEKMTEISWWSIFQRNLVINPMLQNKNISFSFIHWIKKNWNIESFFLEQSKLNLKGEEGTLLPELKKPTTGNYSRGDIALWSLN